MTLGALAGILVAGVGTWWLYLGYKTSAASWPLEEFSAAEWKTSTPEQRYVYYRDLAASGQLDGATKQQVLDLLGSADYEDPGGRSISYTLKYGGADEPLFNSLYFLEIEFRSNGKVRGFEVRAD